MPDTLSASALIAEDSFSSRGINLDLTQRAEEELELLRSNSKGKQRADEFDPDDMSEAQSLRRNSTASYTEQRRRSHSSSDPHSSHIHHRRSRSTESSSSHQRRLLWWREAAINVVYILAWYTFSTVISVYNKWMFAPEHYNFPYPLFVTSVHMVVQWSLSALVLTTFKSLRSPNRPKSKDYLSKVVPCGMATGLDIGLSNLSLRTITLSFYTMCKSSSLAFVLIFAFLFRLETPSWRLVGIIFIITSGVVLMVSTETQFNATGMAEVLTASALGGLRWSLTQILLDKEEMGMGNPFATLFWLAPVMGLTLGTVSMIVDGWGNVLGNEVFFGSFGKTMRTIASILFPGVVAFMMNVTEFGLIQRTSVVTLSVAGIFKEVAVIFVSTVIFHDQLTPINISGLVVTISGIALYNYLKYSQFTKGGASGHGGVKATGFEPVANGDREGWDDEEGPLISPRADKAARALNTTNDSALFLDDVTPHSLGSSPASSPRSSTSSTSRHHLHRTSHAAKSAQNHSRDIENSENQLELDEELLRLGAEEREAMRSLERGTEGHESARDWGTRDEGKLL